MLGIDNQQLQAFAQSPLLPAGGSEADYWNAFLVFLYINGAIQTQPPLETWRSAASASGQSLPAYVATATGLREENVDAWLRAAEIHEIGTGAAIEEMVDMVQAGETIEERFGFSIEGNWSEGDQDDIVEAVLMVSHGMAAATAEADTAAGVFRSVFDGVEITLGTDGPPDTWYCTGYGGEVACTTRAYDRISPQTIAHELGHTFNARVANNLGNGLDMYGADNDEYIRRLEIDPYEVLRDTEITAQINGETLHVSGPNADGGFERTDHGYATLGTPWQQHSVRWGGNDPSGNTPNEDFADMFLNWAYGSLTDDPAGRARQDFMDNHMADWVTYEREPYQDSWLGNEP